MRKAVSTFCWLGCLPLACLLVGCEGGVGEDRSITFSNDGKAVGFQHGDDGVFVTDSETGKPIKIFQPDESILASSTPLWSPDKQRVIFTTAVDPHAEPDESTPATFQDWDDAPEGRRFGFRKIRYTCWLRDDLSADENAEPKKLFDADCGHVGYVAANLAVRWHPSGEKILFVRKVDDTKHGIFEYDLADGEFHRRFPHLAYRILCDYAPGGKYLACTVGSIDGKDPNDGLWISETDSGNWWRVPDSASNATATDHGQLIERLRAARPAWSADQIRFAFVTEQTEQGPEPKTTYVLQLCDVESRSVRRLQQGDSPYHDLHWTPDSSRLAAVTGGEQPELRLIDQNGEISDPVNDRAVRRFAGWNSSGARMAYVVVDDQIADLHDQHWAVLFQPQPLARDAVMLAPGDGSSAGEKVFSGMRVTFPRWSPTEEKLSVWCTFTPTYRSQLSQILRWGLRPGDPAAILDVESGEMQWMTVNPQEKVQVGHYLQIKGDFDEALKWYEQATEELPPAQAPEINESIESFTGPRNFSFFHYYCLHKLGRDDEAAEKLAEFEQTFLPKMPQAGDQPVTDGQGEATLVRRQMEVLNPQGSIPQLLRGLYQSEVFLSLDAAAEGERFFNQALEAADDDAKKLVHATLLAQLLLLQQHHSDYADFATHTLAPLLLSQVNFDAYTTVESLDAVDQLASHLAILSMLPMFAGDFVDALPDDKVAELLPQWERLREKADHDAAKLGCDLFLLQAYRRLGRESESAAAKRSIASNPLRTRLLPEGGIDQLFREFRDQPSLGTPVARPETPPAS